ncbi:MULTISPECIES: hypothetical protein [Sorangium]|uniref:Uncharacterized protein n=1 Tax=Sorangium cellulosum TaxID=56 RepID=A0A4P2QSM8_SORCE|nr:MULTISPECIES: hypothetical protein [Sorangium]AUX33193.1 uncharacterized protein SOCE836_053470 [Sorangium cellulosum]AUX33250.1 uncharacterized protein SOCE836_054040 [Sorangium cellulosum]WCQ92569.1 hypothetical protein NQZ70_05310 [Sorangium sp. Soce836]
MKPGIATPSTLVPPDALEAFGRAVARLAAELAVGIIEQRQQAAAPPRYATAKHNPIGSSRAFLDAARRGDFPSHKVGREVRALWADVDAYILSRPGSRRREERATLEAELAASAAPRRRRAARG